MLEKSLSLYLPLFESLSLPRQSPSTIKIIGLRYLARLEIGSCLTVTSWYTIWAKVIVIVATYRRVVTQSHSRVMETYAHNEYRFLELERYCQGNKHP